MEHDVTLYDQAYWDDLILNKTAAEVIKLYKNTVGGLLSIDDKIPTEDTAQLLHKLFLAFDAAVKGASNLDFYQTQHSKSHYTFQRQAEKISETYSRLIRYTQHAIIQAYAYALPQTVIQKVPRLSQDIQAFLLEKVAPSKFGVKSSEDKAYDALLGLFGKATVLNPPAKEQALEYEKDNIMADCFRASEDLIALKVAGEIDEATMCERFTAMLKQSARQVAGAEAKMEATKTGEITKGYADLSHTKQELIVATRKGMASHDPEEKSIKQVLRAGKQ